MSTATSERATIAFRPQVCLGGTQYQSTEKKSSPVSKSLSDLKNIQSINPPWSTTRGRFFSRSCGVHPMRLSARGELPGGSGEAEHGERSAHGTAARVLPSLSHVAWSGIAELCLSLLDVRQWSRPVPFSTLLSNQGSFPPPALPCLDGNASPSTTLPARPAPRGVPVWRVPRRRQGFPCCLHPPLPCVPPPLPGLLRECAELCAGCAASGAD